MNAQKLLPTKVAKSAVSAPMIWAIRIGEPKKSKIKANIP